MWLVEGVFDHELRRRCICLRMIETRLLVSASPSCLGHPSCHSKVENSFGSSELLKGCCEEAKSLKLYASQLVLVLDGNVMLLGAFDELVDLQNSLLGTNPSSMATWS